MPKVTRTLKKKIGLGLLILLSGCTPYKEESLLKKERSPYLALSRNDPIEWKTWTKKSLNKFKQQNRLIYLSIGYATCYACEKMHRENYLDPMVADILNSNYIPIKVDREERPDIDSYFLNVQSMMMGYGAWPINLILTPDLKPIYSFSYINNSKLKKILLEASKTWINDPDMVKEKGQEFLDKIKPSPNSSETFIKSKQLISDFYARYTHRFDTHFGGKSTGNNFNTKFPVYDEMRLLLRYHRLSNDEQPRKMVEKTLTTMAQSSLFDHIAGGFHRYSMSRDWNTPNFEKTLVDQAGHLRAYTDVYRFKKNDLYRITIEKITQFLVNEMNDELGGFYSSMGSSLNEKEGQYYTWNSQIADKAFTPKEKKIFFETYQLGPRLQHLEGKQLIKRKTSFHHEEINALEKKYNFERSKIAKPLIDKKIVTAYNALAISALTRVARLWNSNHLSMISKRNLNYILNQHRSLNGDLYRRSYKGEVKDKSTLDDYSFLIDALIEMYQTYFDEADLLLAKKLQSQQDKLFFNRKKRNYKFNQPSTIEPLFLFRDADKPSGLSMTYWNLIRLSYYFNDISLRNKARDIIDSYPEILQTDPISYAHLLLSFHFYLSNPKTLIMVANQEKCRETTSKSFNQFEFDYLYVCQNGRSRLPIAKQKSPLPQSQVTYYICDSSSCSQPLSQWNEVLSYTKKLPNELIF